MPQVQPHALFGALDVVAFVLAAIDPGFDAVPVVEVVFPLALVHGPVGVRVLPEAIGLVVFPLAIVHVAVHVPELAVPVCFVVDPVAFIACSIWPHLHAIAPAFGSLPLARVDGSVVVDVLVPVLQFLPTRLLVRPRFLGSV